MAPRGFATCNPLISISTTLAFRLTARHFRRGPRLWRRCQPLLGTSRGYQADHLSLNRSIGASGSPDQRQWTSGIHAPALHPRPHRRSDAAPSGISRSIALRVLRTQTRRHRALSLGRVAHWSLPSHSQDELSLPSGVRGSTFGYQGTGIPMFSLGGPQRLAATVLTNRLAPVLRRGRVHRRSTNSRRCWATMSISSAITRSASRTARQSERLPLPNDFNAAVPVQSSSAR